MNGKTSDIGHITDALKKALEKSRQEQAKARLKHFMTPEGLAGFHEQIDKAFPKK